jgi:MFS family permease
MDESSAKKPTRFFGLSRNVIFMSAVSFLNDLSSDMIFPFIPIFLTSVLGATATFVGLMEGVADSTASILKIVSGRLSDRWMVRKPFAVFGYSLSAVAKPVLTWARAPWHVLVVRFLDRVGKGMRDAPRDALISLSTEKEGMGRAFGFHRGADTLGAALGPLLAAILLPFLGKNLEASLRNLFLLSFVASFFAVLLLKISVREVRNNVDGAEHLFLPKFKFKYLGVPFTIFLTAATVLSLGKASEAFLLLRAQGLGVTAALLPIIYFVYNITFALFSTPAGMVADKIGHRNTFMIGMLIFSGTYFLFSQMTSLLAIWILFAVYGFYSALTEGVGRAIVADLVEERWRATAYGIYGAFTGLALLPASFVFGILWDWFGPSASFRYGAILGFIAFVIFLFLRVQNNIWERKIKNAAYPTV